MITKPEVTNKVLVLLDQLASDWEYEEEITAETYLFSELGFQSLDAVVLGNALQEEYGQPLPYTELLSDIGQRTVNDVAVGEWIEFTYRHLSNGQLEASHD